MSKDVEADLIVLISKIDLLDPKLSMDKESKVLDSFLDGYRVESDDKSLLKSSLFALICASRAKLEIVKVLKSTQANVDLSSTLLVDIDTRYELLLSHVKWLLSNRESEDFSYMLGYGTRLSEEFFLDVLFKVSKFERTVQTELIAAKGALTLTNLSLLISNMNLVNSYIAEVLGSLPDRYDSLAIGLLGV